MPGRKKSNLSQITRNAKRMKLFRSRESVEDREVRLKKIRAYHVKTLATETRTQRECRLYLRRAITTASRAQESIEARETRLAADRERHARSRKSETFTERVPSSPQGLATLGSQENLEEREGRLSADRENHDNRESLNK